MPHSTLEVKESKYTLIPKVIAFVMGVDNIPFNDR